MAGKKSTKRPFEASASPTFQEPTTPLTRAAKTFKLSNADKTTSSGDSSTSIGFTSSGLTWKEEIFSAMRASTKLKHLQDTELEILCICVYLIFDVIPEKLLLNYSQKDSTLIQLAVNNLVAEGILRKNEKMGIITINLYQRELKLLINNDITNFKEEAILDKLLSVLITELSSRKEGNFPYSRYMQDIILNAIRVWELCFKYGSLIEKYFYSLEILTMASYEEVNSKSSIALASLKLETKLLELYGHEDFKTLSVKLTWTSILAKTGKVKQALDELEFYIKFIESRVGPNFKFVLLTNALEKKVNFLRQKKDYSEALVTCNKLLELEMNKYNKNNNLLIHIKHLKSKILHESGQLDEAVKICVEISKEASANDGTNADDIYYSHAKILHSQKKYMECLALLDLVIETRTSKFNCQHSSVLAAKTEKAQTLEDSGEYDLAFKELNSILTICEGKYGAYDIKTLNVNTTIARVLMSKGNEKESLALISEMIKSANEKFGAYSSEVGNIKKFKNKLIKSAKSPKTVELKNKESDHSSSSIVIGRKNNYSEYKKYYLSEYNMPPETSSEDIEKRAFQPFRNNHLMQALREATNIYKKIEKDMGDDCPALEQPLEILIEANNRLQNQKEELAALQKLYRLRMILYGVTTTSNFNILSKIGDLANALDLKAEALVSYQKLYQDIITLKGPDDVQTYDIVKKIALLEFSNYHFDDALLHLNQCLQMIQSRKLEVAETFEVNYFKTLCYLRKGRLDEAFQVCSKLLNDYLAVHKCGTGEQFNQINELNNFIHNIYRRKK